MSSAMQVASLLPGRGPTDVDVDQKPDDDELRKTINGTTTFNRMNM